MIRRPLAACAAVVALWIAVACLDVSSPVTGIASITTVLLPTPSIVVGDTMRDINGKVAPLTVQAFAPNGDIVTNVVVSFTAIDTSYNLHIDNIDNSGFARSDSQFPSPLAKVVAQVMPANGKGVLQTLQVLVPIVPKPVSGIRSNDTTFVFQPFLAPTDTLNANLLSPPLSVTLYGATADTTIQSYIVSYQIVQAPDSNGNGPSVVFYNPSGNDSSIAVTNTSGIASRQLRIRPGALADSVFRAGGVTDTIIVSVHVLYLGKPLPITKDSLFIIPVRANLLATSIDAYPSRGLRGILSNH
jgi:hypothetical protein